MTTASDGAIPAPLVTKADVTEALERVRPRVRCTPVMDVVVHGHRVALKLELLQYTGSFKPRGMFNRLLATNVPQAGVVIASGGNAGLAAAYAAAELGHPAEIFVPTTAPDAKVARIRSTGASVMVVGNEYAEAYAASTQRAVQTGAVQLHAYDQPEVVAGQGTCAAELSQQVPDVDTVFVAVGGGGLIGGIAAWFEARVRIIGVEPEHCPTLHAARAAGHPVDVPVSGVAADSLGARRLGDIAWSIAAATEDTRRSRAAPNRNNGWIARDVLVTDQAITDSRHWLWNQVRLVTEHGGAAALAPLLTGAYVPEADERVAVVLCGSNTDPSSL